MIYQLKALRNKVLSLIKRAYITLPSSDNNNFHIVQISYLGNISKAEIIYPYGMNANAPANTMLLAMNVQGQEENLIGMAYAQKERFKNLKAGEVIVGNPIKQSYVKFLENGDIEIFSNNDINVTGNNVKIEAIDTINLTAPNITFTSGGHTANFGSDGDFEITATNFKVNAHVDLGSGGDAIARIGDTVNVGGVNGTITTGGTNTST